MEYLLKGLANGQKNCIGISKSEYKEIESSTQILSLFSSFTENYLITLESYRKIEMSQHKLALNNRLQAFPGYKGFLENRVVLISTVIGYLSAGRFFQDWAIKHLPRMIGKDGSEKFKKSRCERYDNTPEHRFVEEFRNYVQHKDVPKDITYHLYYEDSENLEKSDMASSISYYARRDKLESDKNFKKIALIGMPDRINILQCIRTHMSGIWEMHDSVVSNYSSQANEARKIVEMYRDRFQLEVGGELTHLCVLAMDKEAGTINSKIQLFLGWDDVRREVLTQLASLKNLSKSYITGKIRGSRNET